MEDRGVGRSYGELHTYIRVSSAPKPRIQGATRDMALRIA